MDKKGRIKDGREKKTLTSGRIEREGGVNEVNTENKYEFFLELKRIFWGRHSRETKYVPVPFCTWRALGQGAELSAQAAGPPVDPL